MLRILAAAVVALTLALGVQTYRLSTEQVAHAKTERDFNAKVAAAEAAGRAAEADARQEERRRYAELEGVVREAEENLARARADADAASDSGRRLRDHIATLTLQHRSAACNPGAPGAGPSADATVDLLADVQRRLDEAQDAIAGFADKAHAAGAACQRSYEALSSPKK